MPDAVLVGVAVTVAAPSGVPLAAVPAVGVRVGVSLGGTGVSVGVGESVGGMGVSVAVGVSLGGTGVSVGRTAVSDGTGVSVGPAACTMLTLLLARVGAPPCATTSPSPIA